VVLRPAEVLLIAGLLLQLHLLHKWLVAGHCYVLVRDGSQFYRCHFYLMELFRWFRERLNRCLLHHLFLPFYLGDWILDGSVAYRFLAGQFAG
jgi:hypothetical protein